MPIMMHVNFWDTHTRQSIPPAAGGYQARQPRGTLGLAAWLL